MEIFSALLAIYAGNSPAIGEFPAQRPVTRNIDVFFDLCLNKRLSKRWWGWWFEKPLRPLWRRCNEISISIGFIATSYNKRTPTHEISNFDILSQQIFINIKFSTAYTSYCGILLYSLFVLCLIKATVIIPMCKSFLAKKYTIYFFIYVLLAIIISRS